MPPPEPQSDWAAGPAKWAAVCVLGGASIAGMGWSIFGRGPSVVVGRDAATFISAPAARSGPPPAPAGVKPADGEPVLLPDSQAAAGDAAAPPSAAPASTKRPAAPVQGRLINLNTATAAELELLPGIGPALAGRIVEDRAKNGVYKRVDDIDRVKGIGPRLLEKIRPMATVD